MVSLADSAPVFQGDSTTVSENDSSVANSSDDFSGVLNGGVDFLTLHLFIGVLGNKRFPLDPV